MDIDVLACPACHLDRLWTLAAIAAVVTALVIIGRRW